MDIIKIVQCITLLELSNDDIITENSIHTNFRKLAKVYHPDTTNIRYKDGAKFRELMEAQEYLLKDVGFVNYVKKNNYHCCSYADYQRKKEQEETKQTEDYRKRTEQEEVKRKAEEQKRQAEEARRRAEYQEVKRKAEEQKRQAEEARRRAEYQEAQRQQYYKEAAEKKAEEMRNKRKKHRAKYCYLCRNEIIEHANFCNRCGTQVYESVI